MEVKLGQARFLLDTKTLVVAGEAVALDRNARQVLFTLCERAGMDVSKDDLLAAGWPDRIVHENSLAKTISRLRTILGADGSKIVAVYGFGYRLDGVQRLVGVQPEVADSLSGADSAGQPASAPIDRRAQIVLGLMALAAVLLLAWGAFDPPLRRSPPVTAHPSDAIGKILWVDDHPENNKHEIAFFEGRHIAVDTALTTQDAIKTMAIGRYDLVISDLGRQDDRLAGTRLIAEMRQRNWAVPVIIYTVRSPQADQQAAKLQLVKAAGAAAMVLSPQEVRAEVTARLIR
jgi:DNA-binding response OmpR family regulator